MTSLNLGPLVEIAPDAGIFEIDVDVRYTDGPASTTCPATTVFTGTNGTTTSTETDRFSAPAADGDRIIVSYKEIFSK